MNNKPEQAARLLNDEFFQYVVKLQQELYISNILNSSDIDIEGRERNFMKYQVVQELVASIESISQQREIDKKRMKFF
jgi:acid stress-induced BolA-like protein IbaG/YrbA